MSIFLQFLQAPLDHRRTTIPTSRFPDLQSQVPTIELPFLQAPTISIVTPQICCQTNNNPPISLPSLIFRNRTNLGIFCMQRPCEQCSLSLHTTVLLSCSDKLFRSSISSSGSTPPWGLGGDEHSNCRDEREDEDYGRDRYRGGWVWD